MNKEENLLLKILQALNRIDNKLEALQELTSLVKIGQQDLIEKTKLKLFKKSSLRKAVYNLCDKKHAVSDIAKELNKSISLISQVISQLQKANLIKEERKGKQKYYIKVV